MSILHEPPAVAAWAQSRESTKHCRQYYTTLKTLYFREESVVKNIFDLNCCIAHNANYDFGIFDIVYNFLFNIL